MAGVAVLDPSTTPRGALSAADIEALLVERLPMLPPLRWRLAHVPFGLDYPYWIDDPNFDLDFHVRELALPSSGSDEQLAEQVARITSGPLDRARPLWELYLIHGLASGHVAMLTKIHHALIDGISGAEIMGLLARCPGRRSRAASRHVSAGSSARPRLRGGRSGSRRRARRSTGASRRTGASPSASSRSTTSRRSRTTTAADERTAVNECR